MNKLTKLSGIGLRLQGEGTRMSGGECCGIFGSGMDDKFLFGNQSL